MQKFLDAGGDRKTRPVFISAPVPGTFNSIYDGPPTDPAQGVSNGGGLAAVDAGDPSLYIAGSKGNNGQFAQELQ